MPWNFAIKLFLKRKKSQKKTKLKTFQKVLKWVISGAYFETHSKKQIANSVCPGTPNRSETIHS